MASQDRDTKVVYTNGTGAGWFVAIVLLIAIAVSGFYFYNSGAFTDSNDINVTIDVPDGIVPAE